MELGKRIAEIRKEHGLTQEGLAEICSVTRQTISNWENGKSYPDLETLVLISDTFDVSLDVNCFEIRQLIGEYGFVLKQLLQLKEEKGMMLSQARAYLDKQVQTATDEKYGEGFAAFLNEAITGFYER